jgi:hypothetical protein
MSEPITVADRVDEVVPGVWRWHVLDERIDFESDAHAVAADGGTVLIDPLPLADAALDALQPVTAICLTAACHQRSAWRYRRALGVKVHAPKASREMDEDPDRRYGDGEALPGGLVAIHTPGPDEAHYAFLRPGPPAVLFCPDLVMRANDGALTLIPAEYHEDPAATLASLRRLLDLPFEILCFDHGAPVTVNPHAALRAVLNKASARG